MLSLIAAGTFTVLLGLDVLLKQHVEENIKSGEEKKVLGGKVVIRKVYNKGFLLNSLESHPVLIKTVSILAGAGVLACGAWTFVRKGHFTEKLGMAILGAGAASNLFDRLSRGKVIDYIGIRSKNQFLARLTANLGDFSILLGAVLLALKRSYPELSEEELKEISEKVKSRKFKL